MAFSRPLNQRVAAGDDSAWMCSYRYSRSREARCVISTRYVILPADLVENSAGRPGTPVGNIVQALPDRLEYVGTSGRVEQALVRFGVLYHCLRPAPDGEYQGVAALAEVL
jgi:hypothetical protein